MRVLQAVSHIVIGCLVLCGHLDSVGQEAEDGTDPEQDGEAAEQLPAELDPLRGGGGRGQGVGTVPGQNLNSSGIGKALREWNLIMTQQPHFHCGLKSYFTATVAEHQVFLPGLFNTTSIINWVTLLM